MRNVRVDKGKTSSENDMKLVESKDDEGWDGKEAVADFPPEPLQLVCK